MPVLRCLSAFDFRFFWLCAIPAAAAAPTSPPPLEALLSQCLLGKWVLNHCVLGKSVGQSLLGTYQILHGLFISPQWGICSSWIPAAFGYHIQGSWFCTLSDVFFYFMISFYLLFILLEANVFKVLMQPGFSNVLIFKRSQRTFELWQFLSS